MWDINKQKSLARLQSAKAKNEVDKKIFPVLERINQLDNYYTTSSCSGRILFIDVPINDSKVNSKVVKKWHKPVNYKTFCSACEYTPRYNLWLHVQSPTLHIACREIIDAQRMYSIAVKSGFDRVGLRSLTEKRYMLEIHANYDIACPIKIQGVMVSKELVHYLWKCANLRLELGNRLILNLYNLLKPEK